MHRTQNNLSRNIERNGFAIRAHKRRSHVGKNTPLTEEFNFRPRMGHSDSLKPYQPEQLIKSIGELKNKKTSESRYCESSKPTAYESNLSVRAKQSQFKQIIRNKAKTNKQLFKMLKEKKESVMPPTQAVPVQE